MAASAPGTLPTRSPIEEIARVDAGSAVTLSVHSMIASAVVRLGTEPQKRQWLPKLAAGDVIAAFALTEPDFGSDAASIRASAKRDGAEYVLNGRKQWCTNGSVAGVTMAMFRTGGGGSRGVSAFLVENTTPGIVVEKITEKLGIHTSNTCDLAFDDVRVPESTLLGREGDGFGSAMNALAGGRIGIAAQATGILAACLDHSVVFAKDRVAFGRAIGAFEGISFKIAQMAMDLDAARLLSLPRGGAGRRGATLRDRGEQSQTLRLDRGAQARGRSDSNPRRIRLHHGISDRAVLPRRQDHRDL